MFALRWAIVVLFTLLAVPAQAQQDWPTKPVRWIVPYAAGGFADTSVRKLTAELTKVLKQSVVVENRAGAGGVVGTEMIAKAAPDGYTFGSGNLAPLAVNPSLMQQLPYDVARDIAPILLIETAPLIRESIVSLGSEIAGGTPEDFGRFIRAEMEKWGKVIREGNIKAE